MRQQFIFRSIQFTVLTVEFCINFSIWIYYTRNTSLTHKNVLLSQLSCTDFLLSLKDVIAFQTWSFIWNSTDVLGWGWGVAFFFFSPIVFNLDIVLCVILVLINKLFYLNVTFIWESNFLCFSAVWGMCWEHGDMKMHGQPELPLTCKRNLCA